MPGAFAVCGLALTLANPHRPASRTLCEKGALRHQAHKFSCRPTATPRAPAYIAAHDPVACGAGGLRTISSGLVNSIKVEADQLYTFLLKNPNSIGVFFKQNLQNEKDAAWLREAVEFTPSLAGLTYITHDQSSKPSKVIANFAIRFAAKTCQEEMQTGLSRAIEATGYSIPKPMKDHWAANYADKPGEGMHVVISTKHMDPGGKEGHYFEISTRAKEALEAMGCTVYNPNTDNPEEIGDQGWLLSFTNNLYHVAQTQGFVYQLQQGKQRNLSDTQLAEEHMGEEWKGRLPVIGAYIPSFHRKWDAKGDSKGEFPDFQLRYDAWRAIHCARRQWHLDLVLPVVELSEHLFPYEQRWKDAGGLNEKAKKWCLEGTTSNKAPSEPCAPLP